MYQSISRSLLDQHSTNTQVGYPPRVHRQPTHIPAECPEMLVEISTLTMISLVAYQSTTQWHIRQLHLVEYFWRHS